MHHGQKLITDWLKLEIKTYKKRKHTDLFNKLLKYRSISSIDSRNSLIVVNLLPQVAQVGVIGNNRLLNLLHL